MIVNSYISPRSCWTGDVNCTFLSQTYRSSKPTPADESQTAARTRKIIIIAVIDSNNSNKYATCLWDICFVLYFPVFLCHLCFPHSPLYLGHWHHWLEKFPQSIHYRHQDVDWLLNRKLEVSVTDLIILKTVCFLKNEVEVEKWVPLPWPKEESCLSSLVGYH